MNLSNSSYDKLKFCAQVILPALGTLYFALSGIWGFPYGEQIVGTLTAVDTFLGVILKAASDRYASTLHRYASTIQGDSDDD